MVPPFVWQATVFIWLSVTQLGPWADALSVPCEGIALWHCSACPRKHLQILILGSHGLSHGTVKTMHYTENVSKSSAYVNLVA